MASAQYLYRRESGIYFVRLCVPTRLKAAVGKGEIHRTTGCRDYRLAKIAAFSNAPFNMGVEGGRRGRHGDQVLGRREGGECLAVVVVLRGRGRRRG